MQPYSQDLRERIIAALEANEQTRPEIAERCGVSVSTVEKLWKRWPSTGQCAALPHAKMTDMYRCSEAEQWKREKHVNTHIDN
jgi:transposase